VSGVKFWVLDRDPDSNVSKSGAKPIAKKIGRKTVHNKSLNSPVLVVRSGYFRISGASSFRWKPSGGCSGRFGLKSNLTHKGEKKHMKFETLFCYMSLMDKIIIQMVIYID